PADLGEVRCRDLGVWTAGLTCPVLCVNLIAVVLVNRLRPAPRQWTFSAVVVLVEWLVLIAANAFVSPVLAGVLASAAVIVLTMARIRSSNRTVPRPPKGFGQALFPYCVLRSGLLVSAGVFAVTGVPSGEVVR